MARSLGLTVMRGKRYPIRWCVGPAHEKRHRHPGGGRLPFVTEDRCRP
jgi:hypothetical protein